MEITFFPDRGSNPGPLCDRPTLYSVAIKAGLYCKAVQVCYVPIPGDTYLLPLTRMRFRLIIDCIIILFQWNFKR